MGTTYYCELGMIPKNEIAGAAQMVRGCLDSSWHHRIRELDEGISWEQKDMDGIVALARDIAKKVGDIRLMYYSLDDGGGGYEGIVSHDGVLRADDSPPCLSAQQIAGLLAFHKPGSGAELYLWRKLVDAFCERIKEEIWDRFDEKKFREICNIW